MRKSERAFQQIMESNQNLYNSFQLFCQFYDIDITNVDYESLSGKERHLFYYWSESYNKSQEFNSQRGQNIYDKSMEGYRMCVKNLIGF